MRRARSTLLWVVTATLALGACGLPRDYVVLLPEDDGSSGIVEVTGANGKTVVAEPLKGSALAGGGAPVTVTKKAVQQTFAAAIAAAPKPPARFVLYFESDTVDLTSDSRKQLPEILAAVRDRPAPDVDVVGHTDTSGADRYNDALAKKRALRIRDEIVAIGVPAKMIEVSSHGKRDLLVPTPDGVHERRNRRVEVIVR